MELHIRWTGWRPAIAGEHRRSRPIHCISKGVRSEPSCSTPSASWGLWRRQTTRRLSQGCARHGPICNKLSQLYRICRARRCCDAARAAHRDGKGQSGAEPLKTWGFAPHQPGHCQDEPVFTPWAGGALLRDMRLHLRHKAATCLAYLPVRTSLHVRQCRNQQEDKKLAIELSQIAILRRVLEDFCSRHDLRLSDQPAIIAARELMRFADEGESDPANLALLLNETMPSHLHREPQSARA